MGRVVLGVAAVLSLAVGCNGGEVVDGLEPLSDRLDALELENATLREELEALSETGVVVLSEDLVLAVPDDAPTLAGALASLDRYRIPAGVSVTIALADGTYALPEALQFTHPDGNRIQVVGNVGSPESVVLFFTGSSSSPGGGRAIRARGPVAGSLDGVLIRGTNAPDTIGVEASDNGVVYLGASVVIEAFGRHGIRATRNGTVYAENVEVRDNGDSGFRAQDGGFIAAWGASSHDNGGDGFRARSGGVIAADPSTASDNGGAGYYADGGWIAAGDGTSSGNGGSGYEAGLGGAVEAWGTSASNNNRHGYAATVGAALVAGQSSALDNGQAGFLASESSSVVADGSTASGNGWDGFSAQLGSSLQGYQSVATNNGGVGFAAHYSSGLIANGATSTNNSEGLVSAGNSMLDGNNAVVDGSSGFGVNVFWGGWMLVTGASVTDSGNVDYNMGQRSNQQPLSGDAWGVAWSDGQ